MSPIGHPDNQDAAEAAVMAGLTPPPPSEKLMDRDRLVADISNPTRPDNEPYPDYFGNKNQPLSGAEVSLGLGEVYRHAGLNDDEIKISDTPITAQSFSAALRLLERLKATPGVLNDPDAMREITRLTMDICRPVEFEGKVRRIDVTRRANGGTRWNFSDGTYKDFDY